MVAFVLFFELETDLINIEVQTRAINKATRLFKKTQTKQLPKTTIAKNVKSYSQRLIGTLKKTFDELIEKGFKYKEEGNVITFFTKKGETEGDVLAQIVNDKFVVKKWGAHYEGEVVKKLDNGYWLVKNGDSYSIDLGFKEGRKLTGEEVNEYYMEMGRSAPYTDDCIVTEEVLKPGKEFYMVIDGIKVENGVKVVNNKPGGWGSNDAITTIKELREDMAVLESWKKLEYEPTRVKYRVTKELPVRNGVVGPQIDSYAEETINFDIFVSYKGGNQQYEIVLPKEANWRDKGWKDYLIELERLELK